MRLFVAVSVGEQFAETLTTELVPLRSKIPLRWTRPDTWHITLQFLDEWPESRIPGLIEALRDACDRPAFLLSPGTLDGVPDLISPRVLFLQMNDDGSSARLAGRVRDVVEGIWPQGPQYRRGFRSHLTLGRCRARLSVNDLNLLRQFRLSDMAEIPVEAFHLVRSDREESGVRHSELARFPLRKKGE
jgi:RNA 2',3'-cyclic 3'-phosphodiesterase